MCTSKRHLDSRCSPVLFAEPDIELTPRDWLARVALNVTDLVLANSLSADLCLECVANERRPGSLSSSAQLVDKLQEPLVNGHLNCLHRCGFRCVCQSTSYTTSGNESSIDARGSWPIAIADFVCPFCAPVRSILTGSNGGLASKTPVIHWCLGLIMPRSRVRVPLSPPVKSMGCAENTRLDFLAVCPSMCPCDWVDASHGIE